MTEPVSPLRKLAERILAKGGDLPLAVLLEHLASARAMRELARKFGLSPKGGFRIEKAPVRVLAPLLAELRDPEQLDQVLALLRPAIQVAERPADEAEPGAPPPAAPAAPAADAAALLALRGAELVRLRDEVERAREAAARAREREAEQVRRREHLEQELTRLRTQVGREARPASSGTAARGDVERALHGRIKDLESEREGFLASDEALRRQLAHNQTRMRALEESVAELEALLPKGRRRHKPPPPPPPDDRRFRMPHFLPSFYKSTVGKDRRSVERAVQAVLLFCTEGHSYPGLEVKQLGGQDTWSLRASLGLRVYFRPLPDGDIELLELADREEQHTTLRRLKER
jgi:hypothetical protein